ncbi:delta-60 repeat domain-containing protein [Hymenobacter volaticus]|uniref:Delta-60 repeat domain-containing protein n=1 Tax=Hymenobacter volaticus TaxID=2932254 RepID=A0ABY4G2F3_9BACT|nr:delta-60 repeat domain-containing protein [Hymenobacter volaticus]UOQ65052.1 delta-60 repeat domain-containing protein [Hymenobacter volaticus]
MFSTTARCSPLYNVWRFSLLLVLLLRTSILQAQTQVDASFGPMQIYQPASVSQVLQLDNGERLVLGSNIVRADGINTTQRLLRYSAAGTLDAVFAVNIANYSWFPQGLADAGDGRVYVTLSGPATLNGQQHFSLVRLLPSGLVDPSFAVQSSSVNRVSSLVVQPDGKVVVAGNFSSYAGQAVGGLIRLNVNGTLDQAFVTNTASGLGGATAFGPVLALQPRDGKLVVGGTFRSAAGQPRSGLARFNPDGTLDTNFAPTTTSNALVGTVAIQPDGKILAATFNGTSLVPNVAQRVVRFTEAGDYDNTFNVGSYSIRPAFYGEHLLCLCSLMGKSWLCLVEESYRLVKSSA